MKNLNLYKILMLSIIIFISIPKSFSQCPEDKNDLILNTQEKHDKFFENYPNCKAYNIIMVNGDFVGDPQPFKYLIVLFALIGGVIIVLKYLVNRFELK